MTLGWDGALRSGSEVRHIQSTKRKENIPYIQSSRLKPEVIINYPLSINELLTAKNKVTVAIFYEIGVMILFINFL